VREGVRETVAEEDLAAEAARVIVFRGEADSELDDAPEVFIDLVFARGQNLRAGI
jgi:hypothetical protein